MQAFSFGDWSAAQSTTPQAVIDYGYYRGASTMAKIAAILGKTGDAAKYSALAANLKDDYNSKYLHTVTSGNAWYANNTEASNAVALDAGLGPRPVPPGGRQQPRRRRRRIRLPDRHRLRRPRPAVPHAPRRGPRRRHLPDGHEPGLARLRLFGEHRPHDALGEPERRRLGIEDGRELYTVGAGHSHFDLMK